MKKIITLVAVATFLISVTGCKKDTQPSQTTLQKIQANWGLQNIVDNQHFSGTDHITTTTGTPADYFDFRTDGKIYYSIGGYKDTIAYSTPTETQLLVDNTELYDIKTLTSNSFIVYKKDLLGGSDYDEETINWKK